MFKFDNFRLGAASLAVALLLAGWDVRTVHAALSESEASWPAWVSLGGKVGNHRELGLVDFFVPISQSDDALLFTDLRGKDAGGPEAEMNIGGGYRRLVGDGWILGAYGYYDRLKSAHSNYFNQATFGAEALTADWDFRGNVYFPEKDKYVVGQTASSTLSVSGNSLLLSSVVSSSVEMALPGFDAEAGYRLPVEGQDIRLYAGGFNFSREGAPSVAGPRTRIEWRVEDPLNLQGVRVTFEGEFSHDDVRGGEGFAGISARIPIDFAGRKGPKRDPRSLKSRMVEPIVRDVDVVSGNSISATQTAGGPAINPVTGLPYSGIWFASQGGAGSGIQEDPTDIATAVASAGANGVVALLDSGGTIDVSGLTLGAGQTLIGSGSTLTAGTASGQTAGFVIGGASTTLTDSGNGVVITLADNNVLNGFTVDGGRGIAGNGIDSVTISGVRVANSVGNGIDLTDAGNIAISDTTVTNSNLNNLIVEQNDNPGNITIDSSTFSGTANTFGILIQNVNGDTRLSNVTSSNSQLANLRLDQDGNAGDLTVLSSTFDSSVGSLGMYITNVSGDIVLSDVRARSNNQTNLYIDQEGAAGGINLLSSTFTNSGSGTGVFLENVNGSTAVSGLTVTGNNQSNFYLNQNGAAGNFTATSSTFSGAANSFGLYLIGVQGNIGISGVIADANQQSNLLIDQNDVAGNVTISSSQFKNSVVSFGMSIVEVNGDTTITDVVASGNNQSNLQVDQGDNAGNISVSSSTFTGSGSGFGADFANMDGSVTLDGLTASNNNQINILVNQNGHDGAVTIRNSTSSNSTNGEGFYLTSLGDGDVTLSGLTASNNQQANLQIDKNNNAGDITISSSVFNQSAVSDGMLLLNTAGDTVLTDVTSNGNNQSNFLIDQNDNAGSLTISSSSFNSAGASVGVYVQEMNGNVQLSNVQANSNNQSNIIIDQNDNTGSVTLNTVGASGSTNGNGVYIADASGAVYISGLTADTNNQTNAYIGANNHAGSVTVDSSALSGSLNGNGLFVDSVNGNVSLTGITANSNSQANLFVEFNGNAGDLTVSQGAFSSSGAGNGIHVVDATGDISISGTVADTNNQHNVVLAAGNDVTVDGLTASNAMNADGLYVDVTGDVLVKNSTATGNFGFDLNFAGYGTLDFSENNTYGDFQS